MDYKAKTIFGSGFGFSNFAEFKITCQKIYWIASPEIFQAWNQGNCSPRTFKGLFKFRIPEQLKVGPSFSFKIIFEESIGPIFLKIGRERKENPFKESEAKRTDCHRFWFGTTYLDLYTSKFPIAHNKSFLLVKFCSLYDISLVQKCKIYHANISNPFESSPLHDKSTAGYRLHTIIEPIMNNIV